MRLGAIRTVGATLLVLGACAVPAQAQDPAGSTGGATTGGSAAPPPATGGTPVSTTPSSPTTATAGTTTTIAGQPATVAPDPAAATGGSMYNNPSGLPELIVPGSVAKIVNGLAAAPSDAPAAVQQMIWTANRIVGMPYVYGGGHGAFIASGYDCSGTVSYALHAGMLLTTPLDSSQFESWGGAGHGQWVTIFANGGHVYMDIAGLRLDTSSAGDPSNLQGPRWRPLRKSNAGYRVRHPIGF